MFANLSALGAVAAAYISRTHPKALSASGSFFIARETFIQVGAIFFKAS